MRRKLIISLLAIVSALTSNADIPFRAHRFDALNTMEVHEGDIVFVGNSITNMHEWWEAFGCRRDILNRGVSGCLSSETMENIGRIVEGHPSKVFLMVGTNDIGTPGLDNPHDIIHNVSGIIRRFRNGSPETELYVQSILPVDENNKRPVGTIMETNRLLDSLCRANGITFIDLWDEMTEPGTSHINPSFTKDGLHLYPSGYRAWCNAIAGYVGYDCIYPDTGFNDCNLPGSFGMRAASFDLLPLKQDDFVIIGDEMVHGGEWHELLGSPLVKGRGTGWGFPGPSIDAIRQEIPAIFSSGENPVQIYVHAGAAEIAGNTPVDTIEARYRRLVDEIRSASPDSKLFLISPQPVYTGHGATTDASEVNRRVQALADESGAGYVDIYSALSKDGRPDTRFMNGNYILGKGYLKIADILAANMGLEPVPLMSAARETSFTGRGNENELLETLTIAHSKNRRLRKVSVRLNADDGDIKALKIIHDGRIVGEVKAKAGKTDYRIRCRCILNNLSDIELCADIADTAKEGGKVTADIVRIKTGLRWKTVAEAKQGFREILLRRIMVLGPGMFGSEGYRIPAIAALNDSTLLITTDKRKFNDLDLPGDIDIIAQRSTDNGRTWSEPITLAEGHGYGKGFGDAALVLTGKGDIVCAYSGGAGIGLSTLDNPQRNFITTSNDGGFTWSEPFDCTSMLWGPEAVNAGCRTFHSAFFASGSGLRLEKGRYAGRIMFIAAVHSQSPWRFDNYAVYSDDDGSTWKVSGLAFTGGDEAKAVELPDGRILLSVRRSGERGFNVSCDGGVTWGEQGLWPDICTNACDGDIINIGDTLLLHSVPNDMTRRNVSVFVSRDNGETWPYVKSICPYESVYSSITELPDGTIGAYLEENPRTGFEMWYMNFSIDWLLNKEQQAYGKSE